MAQRETFTAPAVIDREELTKLEQEARQRALEQAEQAGARVKQIGDIEKEQVQELLAERAETVKDAPPTETAELQPNTVTENKPETKNAPTMTAEQAEQELVARAKKADAARVDAIGDTPDAKVVKPDGDMLAVQFDGNREVGITTRGLTEDAVETGLTERASTHEAEHTLQETGDQAAELPKTGNPAIDGYRQGFRRLTFRENGAIKAEGGLNGHTAEYAGFVKYADAVKGELNAAGENGDALVHEAGRTVEGFRKIHAALAREAIAKEMKKGNMTAAREAAETADQFTLAA